MPDERISRMQYLVLACLAGGMTFQQVSYSLGLSKLTVQHYKRRIKDRWHLDSESNLVLIKEAERRGVLQ